MNATPPCLTIASSDDKQVAGSTSARQESPSSFAPWAANRSLFRLALLLILAFQLFPIWAYEHPGMVDYPNHLVRCYLLAHLHSNPVFAQRYTVPLSPLPNLAIEMVVIPLNHFLPIILSGKIFLTLALLLFTGGCLDLGRTITGRPSWLALAASFTFYNSNFLFGFVNYIFGIGVFLCIFAFWLRQRERMRWSRFALFCILSLVAYLVHLSCLAFLVIACTTVALMDLRKDRNSILFVRRIAWLGCPLILMAGFLTRGGTVGVIRWSSLPLKIIHLLSPIRSYNLPLDIIVFCFGIALVALLLRSGTLNAVGLVGGVFFFMFLITPHVLFTSEAADVRYVTPAFLVFVLAIQPVWKRSETAVFAVLMALLVVRGLEINYFWQIIDQREARLLRMGDVLTPDAQVLVLFQPNPDLAAKRDRGFSNVLNFWTVSHNALVTSLFTYPGQQPIGFRGTRCPTRACILQYDFVWTNGIAPDRDAAIQGLADPVARWEDVTLWRVRR